MAANPTLYAVTGRARKCGPAAIAAVLGCSTDDAAALLRRATGRKAINRVWHTDVAAALKLAGADSLVVSETPHQTMNQWAKAHRADYRTTPTIVLHGSGNASHFGVFLADEYMCIRTNFELVPVSDLPKPLARVRAWVTVYNIPKS